MTTASVKHCRLTPIGATAAGIDASIAHKYPACWRTTSRLREEHGINLAGFLQGTALGHPEGRTLLDMQQSLAIWERDLARLIAKGKPVLPRYHQRIRTLRRDIAALQSNTQ